MAEGKMAKIQIHIKLKWQKSQTAKKSTAKTQISKSQTGISQKC